MWFDFLTYMALMTFGAGVGAVASLLLLKHINDRFR